MEPKSFVQAALIHRVDIHTVEMIRHEISNQASKKKVTEFVSTLFEEKKYESLDLAKLQTNLKDRVTEIDSHVSSIFYSFFYYIFYSIGMERLQKEKENIQCAVDILNGKLGWNNLDIETDFADQEEIEYQVDPIVQEPIANDVPINEVPVLLRVDVSTYTLTPRKKTPHKMTPLPQNMQLSSKSPFQNSTTKKAAPSQLNSPLKQSIVPAETEAQIDLPTALLTPGKSNQTTPINPKKRNEEIETPYATPTPHRDFLNPAKVIPARLLNAVDVKDILGKFRLTLSSEQKKKLAQPEPVNDDCEDDWSASDV